MAVFDSTASAPLVDPADPRCPALDQWHQLSPQAQREVIEALAVTPHPVLDAVAPEGTRHDDQVADAADRLRQWFGAGRRCAFVARNLRVYYPGAAAFDPDLLVVLDVPQEERDTWVVAAEGRGIDIAIEVIWKGDRAKDLDRNVREYARLGIPEYYVIDLRRARLHAFHLGAAAGVYVDHSPATGPGPVRSPLLGLDLHFDGVALSFLHGITAALSTREGIARLQVAMSALSRELQRDYDLVNREETTAEQERAKAEQEKARADELERTVAELRAALAERTPAG